MRNVLGFGLASAAGVVATMLGSSCGSTEVTCEDLANCARPNPGQDGGSDVALVSDAAHEADAPPTSDGAADATDTADAAEASDAARMEAEAGCTSSLPLEAGPCVADGLVVFVSTSGNDATAAVGKRGAAYRSITAALRAAKAGPRRLYICDDGAGYPESVVIDAAVDPELDGVEIYGGFECTGWTYVAGKRAKVNPAAGSALQIKGIANGLTLADVELVAASATAPGTSSIGVIVDSSVNVSFLRARIASGAGASGANGADGDKGLDAPLATNPGQKGANATCSGTLFPMQPGGSWPSMTCGSLGGPGGTANAGNDGSAGLPGLPRGPDNGGPKGGQVGGPGVDGVAGLAGVASGAAGSFSVTGYKAATAGGDGADGAVGQGGGGGGASNATALCIGASGGAGGMGGCGGKKGLGGGSGGASIALLSWSSRLTLDSCEISSGNGGNGGGGGKGGLGGVGSAGAEGGLAFASDAGDSVAKGGKGGTGGNGGLGGSGAGGAGGPSYAMVYKGQSPSKTAVVEMHGAAGMKGIGGSQTGGVKAPDGASALADDELQVN